MIKEIGEMEEISDHGDNFKIFRTTCACTSDQHQLTMVLEADRRDGVKSATFYYKTIIEGWWFERKDADDWKEWLYYLFKYGIDTVIYRVKKALRVLFTGSIELEGDFMFRGDEQILAVASAMINLVKADKKEEPPQEHKDPCDGCMAGPKSECPSTPDAC